VAHKRWRANEQIAAEVGKNSNGVGYVGMAYTKAGGVKVVPVDGIVPSAKSVQDHSYAYWRPTFYYTNGEPSGLANNSSITRSGRPVKKSSPKLVSFRSSKRLNRSTNIMKTVLLTLVALGVATVVARADTLVIKGSDTLGAKLVPQLAEEFKAQHPGTTFNIAAEGSTTGISRSLTARPKLGMSSRPTNRKRSRQQRPKA